MESRLLVLGAGFAGLELATILSEALGDEAGVTLIDEGDAFIFGFAKLDVMFGRAEPAEVRARYADFSKPGVRFLNETIVGIDPEARRVTTEQGVHEAEVLVVALGADYDFDATPGLREAGEFYSVVGAERMREVIPTFTSGHAIVGVCGAPYKCPPAPSEAALLLHDHLTKTGLRGECEISLISPLGTPVPPSPETSTALLEAFAERGIDFLGGRAVKALPPGRNVAVLDDGTELPYDLFLGVPKHRAPQVVLDSGMAVDGYIPADSRTLQTRFPNVYAVGDVATVGVPKAGVFSEGQARTVADALLGDPSAYNGRGSCYIEFGSGRVGRVDVDFLSPPKPTGTYNAPSAALATEKEHFGSSRRERWFGATR